MSWRHIILIVTLAMPWSDWAGATELSLSLKPEYSTGDYGTNMRTRVWQTPFEVKLHEGGHGIGLRLPYIVESGNQTVVRGLGPVGNASATSYQRQGLGNFRLSAWTRLWEDPDSGITLGLAARVTPPAIRGLQPMGVNFTRLSLLAEASIPLPYQVNVDLSLGRRVIIGAPGLDLRDFWFGTVDVTHNLSQFWSIGMTIDVLGASSSSSTDIVEAGPWVEYEFSPGWRVGAYMFRGFTRDSADWGAGLTLVYRFSI